MSETSNAELNNYKEIPTIREDLVKTAIKFLENPNVIKTSLAEQQNFLRRKGLTDEEIRTACERSGAYLHHEQRNQTAPPLPPPIRYSQAGNLQVSLFDRVKEIVQNISMFSIVIYAVYKLYEKFIAPFLFGKKKKDVQESLEDIEKNLKESMGDLQNQVTSVKVEVEKINQGAESSMQRQLSDLKSEIATVKGLLLSRSQFPSVSKGSRVRPSIPEWQKTSLNPDSDPDSDPDRKAEDLSEAGSGASSEHDHTTKSDSSLDIISYSSKDDDFQRIKRKHEDDDKD